MLWISLDYSTVDTMKPMKLVSNQMSPHFTGVDGLHLLGQMMAFWRRPDLSEVFGTKYYKTFNLARNGLRMLAQTITSERKIVGIPAFTCGVVATPFLEEGWTVKWIDTDMNGVVSIDSIHVVVEDIDLLVIPHVYGHMYDRAAVYDVAREHEVMLVEDCAHCFDINTQYCDVKLLSFGREKDLSCVSGGAILWEKDNKYNDIWSDYLLPKASFGWTVRHGIQPLIVGTAAEMWHIGIGKVIAKMAKMLRLLPRAVTPAEKKGREDMPMMQLPKGLARVLYWQWNKRSKALDLRRKKARFLAEILRKKYGEEAVMVPDNAFRVVLKTDQAAEIKAKFKTAGYDLRDWDGNPIAPKGVDLEAFGYKEGQCPNAEKFSAGHVTFPTNRRTRMTDILRVKSILG